MGRVISNRILSCAHTESFESSIILSIVIHITMISPIIIATTDKCAALDPCASARESSPA